MFADLSMIEPGQRSMSDIAGINMPANRLRSTSKPDFYPPREEENQSSARLDTEPEADGRIPCEFCGRKFNPEVSLKHVPICRRNYEKKHGPLRR